MKKSKPTRRKSVSLKLALAAGVSTRTASEDVRARGAPSTPAAYVRWRDVRWKARQPSPALAAARLRKLKAETETLELELHKLKELYISKALVRRDIATAVGIAKQVFCAIPDSIVSHLVGLDEAAMKQVLQQRFQQAFEILSSDHAD